MPLSRQRNRDRMRLNRLHTKIETADVQPNIPLYDATAHRSGDTVRMLRGKREVIVTIPELDADGQWIPE